MQPRNSSNARGIDVSHYQGAIRWNQVKNAGYSFAFIKATEGKDFVDSWFADNVNQATSAGLLTGAYHFCRAFNETQAIAEADHFLEVIQSAGGMDLLELPPVLDMETPNNSTRKQLVSAVKAFIGRIKEKSGRDAILYTYPYFIDRYLDASSLRDIPLWLASYSPNPPQDKGGWNRWLFLQYTEKGTVPGIDGPVDLNEFDGGEDELMAIKASLDPGVANTIINTWMVPSWHDAFNKGNKEQADYIGWLADELRVASGQKPQNR